MTDLDLLISIKEQRKQTEKSRIILGINMYLDKVFDNIKIKKTKFGQSRSINTTIYYYKNIVLMNFYNDKLHFSSEFFNNISIYTNEYEYNMEIKKILNDKIKIFLDIDNFYLYNYDYWLSENLHEYYYK